MLTDNGPNFKTDSHNEVSQKTLRVLIAYGIYRFGNVGGINGDSRYSGEQIITGLTHEIYKAPDGNFFKGHFLNLVAVLRQYGILTAESIIHLGGPSLNQ